MLAVLSDDFTGGAEVAAIAVRHGLTAEVHTTFQGRSSSDLVVVDTHTRSGSREEAIRRIEEEVEKLRLGGIDRVFYKKVDSVLRGRVAAEIQTLLAVTSAERAILAPFNPSFGQAIVAGEYRIAGTPLDRTHFSQDPEYPARTAHVLSLLGHGTEGITYREPGSELPSTGLVVAGGSSREDLLALGASIENGTLPAGGAEFFDIILEQRFRRPAAAPSFRDVSGGPAKSLFVIGSAAGPTRRAVDRARETGVPISTMPAALFHVDREEAAASGAWAERVLDGLAGRHCVVIAVTPGGAVDAGLAPELPPRRLAALVRLVLEASGDELHLYVSGGATVSALVRELRWDSLRVIGEVGRGVVTLAAPGATSHFLTVKPGSYPWPDAVTERIL